MEKEQDTREKLIEISLPLFARKGFTGVSIREIAEAAGVNSALISYHFGGKTGLYTAVVESEFSRLVELAQRTRLAVPDPVQFITAFAKGLSALHRQHPYLLRLANAELNNPTDCLDSVVKKGAAFLVSTLSRVIEEGITMKKFRPDIVPHYAALSLAGIINFYFIVSPVFTRIIPNEISRSDAYVEQAVDIYLRGISL